MTKKRKSLGFTELQWICPFCEGVNRGRARICGNCSAAQPADVTFIQPAQERLIADEAEVAEIRTKSADVHCGYCGTRNDATNATCTRCLADLSEGTARVAGKMVGAHRDKAASDVVCPSCTTPNSAENANCQNCGTPLRTTAGIAAASAAPTRPRPSSGAAGPDTRWMMLVGAVLVVACVVFFMLSMRTTEVIGTVQAVEWQRSVPILALGPVEYDTWWDNVPTEGEILMCEERPRYTSMEPDTTLLSVEICGTPYTVDQGNGFGEVVQDCEYEIHDDWCEYVVDEWKQVDVVTAQGDTFVAYWPDLPTSSDFRPGDATEKYQVQFRADGKSYLYTTGEYDQFERVQAIDDWILDVNTFGSVVSIAPAR